jgi:c-di-GMP-binding flagellar brake protein YcgR
MPTFEFRKLFRTDIILKIEYKTLKKPLLGGIAFSKNISSTGINIVMAQEFTKGTELEITIYLSENETVVAKGTIVWQSACAYIPPSKIEYNSTGIQFSYMSNEDAIRTSDFVREILKKHSEQENQEIIQRIENLTAK